MAYPPDPLPTPWIDRFRFWWAARKESKRLHQLEAFLRYYDKGPEESES